VDVCSSPSRHTLFEAPYAALRIAERAGLAVIVGGIAEKSLLTFTVAVNPRFPRTPL